MTSDASPHAAGLTADIPSPCYVLQESLLEQNLQLLQYVARSSGARILCALKGYAMWSTFPIVRQYLDGATASSLHEARLCFDEMQRKAHLCAPVYFDGEFDEIAAISTHITFNSFHQYRHFRSRALQHKLRMGIRINPEFSTGDTALYDPCTPGSRLGVTADTFADTLPDEITGLHFHTLCEQNADALQKTLAEVERKFGQHLHRLEWFNMGGGHHITRSDYDVKLLIDLVLEFRRKYDLEVFLEPGEAVGWKTGFLLSTVQDIVQSGGIRTAILDVSFSAHMPDCLEMPYKPEIRGTVPPENAAYRYRMGGLTCLAGDFMGDYGFMQPLKPGDRIIFEDMIHYTMVKNTTFNGVKLPSIGTITKEGHFNLVRSFGYEDYKGRLS
jgi:carboxynorspermidine decarboxylase